MGGSPKAAIEAFLGRKRIALVGASRDARSFSRALLRELSGRGYEVVPVNPNVDRIEETPCRRSILDVAPPVDAAFLAMRPKPAHELLRNCAAAGVRTLWFIRGAESDAALDECRSLGIDTITGECPFMFLPGAELPHRIHRFFRQVTGRLP